MPRNLPPIELLQSMNDQIGSITNTKNSSKVTKYRENNIDAKISPSHNQSLLNGDKSQNDDYIEADFRYLTMGSPAPIVGLDQAMSIPDVTDDSDTDFDDFESCKRIEYTPSSRRHIGVGARPKDKYQSGVHVSNPAIKVDRCDENIQDGEHSITYNCREDSADESWRGDESSRRGLESSNTSSLLLDPSPPMCRKRHTIKVVTYYQPSMTRTRSQGSTRGVVRTDHAPNEVGTECIGIGAVGTRFHSNIRPRSSSPTSVSSTEVILLPLDDASARSFSAVSCSKLGHGTSNQRSTTSNRSPSVLPQCSPTTRCHPGRVDRLIHTRPRGDVTDRCFPKI
jgi:hypothetical protein